MFVAVLLVLAAVTVVGVLVGRSIDKQRDRIRARYQEMRDALSHQDTNAALALIAPEFRDSFNGYRFSMLNDFAQPLESGSSIIVWEDNATVCPVRTWHFGILPGGHTIKMVRVEGDWFFTGKVSID